MNSLMTAIAILSVALPLRAAPNEAVLIQDGDNGSYIVEGSFVADVPVLTAWDVLTDYAHLTQTVDSMVSSLVLESNGPEKLVEQVARGGFFIFNKTVKVRLKVREAIPFRIDFEDQLKSDFKLYAGSWQLEGAPQGVRIHYSLTVSRGTVASEAIERWVFKKEAGSLLRQLRAEIERRGSGASILQAVATHRP